MLSFTSKLLVPRLLLLVVVNARDPRFGKAQLRAKQAEAAKRWGMTPGLSRRAQGPIAPKNITFKNPGVSRMYISHSISYPHPELALEFYVDGTSIPEVGWDVGPSWSGLLPISSDPNETRKVSIRNTLTRLKYQHCIL